MEEDTQRLAENNEKLEKDVSLDFIKDNVDSNNSVEDSKNDGQVEREEANSDDGTEKVDSEKKEEDSVEEPESEGDSDYEDYSSGDEFSDPPVEEVRKVCIRRKINPELPSTATILKTKEGGKIYLVGTVHFSHESQEDVATTIRETQPDIVVVELCNNRVNILSMDEKRILEESKDMNFQKMRLAIKQNGLVQGMMYLLLLSMSAHLTKQLGMAPGGEFRRAFLEARKVPGCILHLGDRPISITLQRALGALSLWQKLRLAWYIFTSKEPITKEEVERFKRSDLLEELLAEMTGEFPALSRVFVTERDYYLAYSLKLAATPVHTTQGVVPAVVVGVVGIGHVPGIVEHWEKVTEEDIAEVMKIPKTSLSARVFRVTIRTALVGGVIWGASRLLLPTRVYSTLSPRHALSWISTRLNR